QMEAREGAASDEGAAEGAAPAPASAEDTGEAGASEQPPVGEAPSEAQSKAVEAEQPEETAPPVTTGGGSSDLEGAVGTKNRGRAGKRKEEGGRPRGRASTHDAPPPEQEQRKEEAGDFPPAEMSQAAFKGADLHEEGVAGQAEAAVEDETPGTAPSTLEPQYTGPEVETPEDVAVPDELAQPADEAVRALENEAEGSEGEERWPSRRRARRGRRSIRAAALARYGRTPRRLRGRLREYVIARRGAGTGIRAST